MWQFLAMSHLIKLAIHIHHLSVISERLSFTQRIQKVTHIRSASDHNNELRIPTQLKAFSFNSKMNNFFLLESVGYQATQSQLNVLETYFPKKRKLVSS